MPDSIDRWENEGGALAPGRAMGAPTRTDAMADAAGRRATDDGGSRPLQSKSASASSSATVVRAAPAARHASSSS
jgi:hypothetical protein